MRHIALFAVLFFCAGAFALLAPSRPPANHLHLLALTLIAATGACLALARRHSAPRWLVGMFLLCNLAPWLAWRLHAPDPFAASLRPDGDPI